VYHCSDILNLDLTQPSLNGFKMLCNHFSHVAAFIVLLTQIESIACIATEQQPFHFLPQLPSPRQEHAVAAAGNRIYILGGISGNHSFTPSTADAPSTRFTVDLVQSYNIEERKWSEAASLPTSINHGNAAVVGDAIYLLGGLLGDNFTLWGATPNTYMLDTKTNRWSDLAPMPAHTARGACAVGVWGSEIFLAGGKTWEFLPLATRSSQAVTDGREQTGMRSLEIGPTGLQDSVAIVSSCDTRTGAWKTDYPPLPSPRDHVGGAIVGDKFYVVGGRDRGQYNVRGDTWALDLENVAAGWKGLARMPTPRGGLAAASAGYCIYTFGGEGNRDSETGLFDEVEAYDTRTDVWQRLAPLWAGVHGTAAVAYGREIYLPGGGYRVGAGAGNTSIAYRALASCFE
jgi:N-acetylneuraminic acid mutarotase